MKDFEKLDQLLRSVMHSNDKPSDSLNQQIIDQFNRRDKVKTVNKKRMPIVAVLSILILAISVSAYAAWQFLTPKQVAEHFEDISLAKAFEGKDAIIVNETQTSKGYKITLHGIVSGKAISDFEYSSNGDVHSDRTYAVITIEKTDGTPMPDINDPEYDEMPFFVSPYIRGQNPKDVNIITMNGAYSAFIKDGIWYRLVECDDIEIFADRGLYLGVTSTTFFDIDAYKFNSETGEIVPNEDYKGVNVLFDLPLNPVKGNHEKAEKYLKELTTKSSSREEDSNSGLMDDDVEKLLEGATLIPESVQEIVPDEQGVVTYSFDGFETKTPIEVLFDEEDQIGFSECFYVDADEDVNNIEQVKNIIVFSRDEDGVIKGMIYKMK